MAEETIVFNLAVDGADTAVRDFAKAEKSVKNLEDVSKKSAKTFGELGDVSDKVGRALSSLSPTLATFANQLDDAGKAVVALTGFIGGPAGIAVGGVVAALALWKTYTDEAAEAQTKLAEETRKAAQQVKTLDDYIREVSEKREAKSRAERFNRGGASPDEIQAEIMRLEGLKLGDKEFGVKASRIERLRLMLAEAQASDAQGMLDEIADESPAAAPRRAARAGRMARTQASTEPTLDDLMRDAQGGRFGDVAGIADKAGAELEKSNKQRADAELRAAEELAKQKIEIERARLEEQERLEQEQFDRMVERNAMIVGAMQAVGGATINAFQAMAKGQKVTSKQIISSIGDQMSAEGQRWLWTGAARALMGDPSGSALIGIGLGEIAAGMALGAAGAGSAPPGGAGGGRGGAAEPVLGRDMSARGSGTNNNVVVNVSTLKADADLGVHVQRALDEKRMVYG